MDFIYINCKGEVINKLNTLVDILVYIIDIMLISCLLTTMFPLLQNVFLIISDAKR